MTVTKVPRAERDAALEAGWLSEMVDLYGPPRIQVPTGRATATTYDWRWSGVASVRLRVVGPSRYRPELSVLAVSTDACEVEVRCADGLPTGAQVRGALVAAGVLPCPACRGLREELTGRDNPAERWSRCACTPESARPVHGWAEVSA